MAESKRTFGAAKMDRDSDERIVKPGEYRDALNVSVDFSEDGNVGAIENLKGNQLIANQNILGLSSTSNPNAKVIGTYANPEADKIYYFVTGDNSDGIFEYDGTGNGSISTVIIDSSIAPPTPAQLTFQFSDAGAQASVAQNGAITVVSELGEIESITNDFNETVSTTTARDIDVRVRVPDNYSNKGSYVYNRLQANQAPIAAPQVIQNEPSNIATTSFKLNGEYTNDSAALTDIGFYWIVNTGGSSTINVYANKFVVTENKVKNNNALLGEVFPRVVDPFDGVSSSDIIVIDKNNATVSSSTYTFTVSQGNNPAEITFSSLPSFPVTVAQTSTATTLSNAYTAAQIQASGTQVSLSSAITSPFSTTVTGQTQGTQIAAIAYATNSVGTTLSDIKYFTIVDSSVNRISGTQYVVVPVIEDTLTTVNSFGRNTDEINNRNVGYGPYQKTSGDRIIAITAPSSDGIENNATNVSAFGNQGGAAGFSSNPSGLAFKYIATTVGPNGYVWLDNFASNTSYQITIPATGSISSKTIRINNGTPSGTYHTSTLNLNLSGVFVAKASLGGAYRYNDSTSSIPVASYVLGPVLSGETAQCIIPLNNVNTLFTNDAAQAFVGTFDPGKLSVTVTGKIEGVDYNYYVENTSTAIFGNVPGIIFEGTPSLLGTTPTVNITYTP